MAFRVEKNGDSYDTIIDGFEKGIADDPYEGLADVRNLNVLSTTKEAAVNFATQGLTTPPSSLGTVTFTVPSSTVSYLVVAGGGAGSGAPNGGGGTGGGGAGGMLTGTVGVSISTIAVTVGAGGVGASAVTGASGANSVFFTVTSTGGGGGGNGVNGVNGGSGGGAGLASVGGTGVVGQGHDGGTGAAGGGGGPYGAGGGGGATAVGANGGVNGGNGGAGTASSITGASVTYAGGGAGGSGTGSGGTGGAGGGGNGGSGDANGTAGTANTGGGGGGASSNGGGAFTGGSGGSGKVVISYTTGSLTATGGTITTSGGNTIHTFNSSSNFIVTAIPGVTASTFNTASTTGFVAGMGVKITSSSITGVTNGATYYVGTITSTTFQLFPTISLGTPVPYTSGGTATFTVPQFGKPVDSVATSSNTFDSTTGQNYKWDFIVDDAGLIWYIGNGATGTLNQVYFTGNVGHSTATTANVTAFKGYLFGLMATQVDYIKITTWLSTGPSVWVYAWQAYDSSSVGHRGIPATDDALYICNASAVASLLENPASTFDPTNAATYTWNTTALALPSFDLATCLAQLGVSLLVGGIENFIYPWNRVAPSFTYPLIVAEAFTKCIVSTNNNAYVFAGRRGYIYLTNGSGISVYKKFPDQLSNTENPYYTWGWGIYFRNQLYFSVSAVTNAGAAVNNFAGMWGIDLASDALYLANSLSYSSYTGSVPVILPMGNVNPAGLGIYLGWVNGSNVGGIDAGASTPYVNYEAYVDTDMLPVGTYYSPVTDQQIEYKLAKPLITGEGVQVFWRGNLTDAFTQIANVTAVVGQLSGAAKVNFQKQQWVQLRVKLTSTATNPSYTRLREVRLR